MRYSFVTLFPNLVEPYFQDSILKRATDAGHIQVDYLNPRDYSDNRWDKTDDTMMGGGAGMLMTPQPLDDCLNHVRTSQSKTLFLLPAGKPFQQNDAKRLSQESHLIFVCSRYEGLDERIVESHADEVFSIGDYILTGGELPAMVMADAISRCLPGVLGNESSLEEESFENVRLEAPSFTKPNIFKKNPAPSVLLKGNHSKIHAFKKRLSLCKTRYFRPDMYVKYPFEEHKNEK